jgi:hypothetical protein
MLQRDSAQDVICVKSKSLERGCGLHHQKEGKGSKEKPTQIKVWPLAR